MLSSLARRSARQLRWIAGARSGAAAVVQTIVGRFLMLGMNLFNGILTARHLGSHGRGAQAAMSLWPQLACFVLTLGVPFALIYHARKHETDRDSLSSTAVVLSLILGVVAMLAGIAFVPFWLRQYDAETIRGAQTLMLFAPVIMLSLTMNSLFEVRFDFTSSNLLRYVAPLLTLVALLGLLALHRFTPFNTSLAYFVPVAIVPVALGVRVFGTFRFTLAGFAHSTRRLLGYGVRIYGAGLLYTVSTQVDQLLVVSLLTASSLGLYTVALNISRVLFVFYTSLGIVLVPKATGQDTKTVVQIVGRLARLSTATTTASGILLFVAMPLIMPKLYGHDFLAGVLVSQILIVEAIVASTIGVLSQAFVILNRPGLVSLVQLAGLGLAVPLMLVLIPRIGLVGAALALLASTVVRFVSALVCYPAILKEAPPKLIATASDFRYLIETLRRRVKGGEPSGRDSELSVAGEIGEDLA